MDRETAHPRISIDPEIMLGKPCIKDTRVPIYLILRKLAAGQTETDIHEAYPGLKSGDVAAALAFAADHFDEPVAAAE
jgi:uncharacterized protein (DUF433 family)